MIHGGSDGPVEEILPIEAMRAAMERRDGSGGIFMPDECLNLNETLSLFTLGVAQGVRAENNVGSLKPGQFADFNIWNEETDLNADSVEKFKVTSSFVNGNLVFSQN